MKLRLPLPLFRAVLAACAVAVTFLPERASAAYLHSDVSLTTYTDFAQNCGRYAVVNTSALQNYLSAQGVYILYTGGQEAAKLAHPMIDFSSAFDVATGAAVGVNAVATVQHNGALSGTFAAGDHAIRYYSMEYRSSDTFLLTPQADYKLERQSKLITDITPSTVYTGDVYDGTLTGSLVYRAGSGVQYIVDYNRNPSYISYAYCYATGGVNPVDSVWNNGTSDGSFCAETSMPKSDPDSITETNILPYDIMGGDSGSPVWTWNTETGEYQYLAAMQGGDSIMQGNTEWTTETLASFDKGVTLASGNSSVSIGAVTTASETVSDSSGHSMTKYSGTVSGGADGDVSFIGVQSGISTWCDLSALKDEQYWYTYDNSYMNVRDMESGNVNTNGELTVADLFYTENLVFTATDAAAKTIQVAQDVDLGLGYVQLSKSADAASAEYTISGDGQLNSAGYVVDAGVTAHLQLSGDADHMYEWRKIGDGTLVIEGSDDNNVLLNLGGSGTTILNRANGSAAYNVLANNGTTVRIADAEQIERDFSFGFRGATLDMNGVDMEWNNDNGTEAAGFTIHAEDDGAVIANTNSGDKTTLTWTQTGERTFEGSFADTADSAMEFVYNGGSGSKLTLHSIHTNLQNAASGLTVQSGTLVLKGTVTEHAWGSGDRYNDPYYNTVHRLVVPNDWHYADSTAAVTVQSGAEFRLEDHARLSGNVTVQNGGTFTMTEGVQNRYEYIEGGELLEDTDAIADFFGLKGGVTLVGDNATMRVQFSDEATSRLVYGGSISGSGSLSVATGSGSLVLSGTNTFTGSKTLENGTLIAATAAALGNTTSQKWVVKEGAVLSATGISNLADYLDTTASGTYALSEDTAALGTTGTVYIGALEGKSVTLGSASGTLAAQNGRWYLGGGGGELTVLSKLTGEGTLEVGSEGSTGTLILGNAANDFTGAVNLNGQVILGGYIGNAAVNLAYGQAFYAAADVNATISNTLSSAAAGVLLLDKATAGAAIDLADRYSLYLGAGEETTVSGTITCADEGDYQFGGPGTLHIADALTDAGSANLYIDGQGFSGGVIDLQQASTIDDAVYVQGNQTEGGSGDITLRLSVDNALARTSGTTVKTGGIIDIGTTTQTLNNVTTAGGSLIGSGTLNVTNGTFAGGLNVGTVIKTGQWDYLTLSDTNTYGTLDIRSGYVKLGDDAGLSNVGKTIMRSGTWITTQGHNVNGAIEVDTDGSSNTSIYTEVTQDSITINSSLNVVNGELKIENKGVANAVFNGGITIAEGGLMRLMQLSTTTNFTFNEGEINLGSTGTIRLEGPKMTLNNAWQSFGGTIEVISGQAAELYASSACDNAVKNINALKLDSGSNVTLTQNSWNTIWNIGSLQGQGTLTWNSTTTHNNSSRIILNGEGDFSGSFIFNSQNDYNGSDRAFQKFIEIAHDRALQNATVDLEGKNANAQAALAINTDNARLSALKGNTYSALYAGAASPAPSSTAPVSTRTATLTLTGNADATYSGVITAGDDGNGLTLVKQGSGTQTLNGSSVALNALSVEAGTLAVSAGTFSCGNVSISTGATLDTTSLSLDEGKTLAVNGGSGTATLTGTLTLDGGVLSFDGATVKAGGSLSIGSLAVAEGVTVQAVDFTEAAALTSGSYTLSSSDWSAARGMTFTTSGLSYFTAGITASASGLTLDLAAKSGVVVWSGSNAAELWSATTGVFNDTATTREVQVGQTGNISSVIFDNTQDYSFTSADGAAMTADSIVKNSSGSVALSGGLSTSSLTINEGTVILRSNSVLSGTSAVHGAGTLAIDLGTATFNTNKIEHIDHLQIRSGQVKATTDVASAIEVQSGAQLYVNESLTGTITLAGEGISGTALNSALDIEYGVTLSGAVTLAADATLKVGSGCTAQVNALDAGDHTLTKIGSGTLQLNSGSLSGTLEVQEGTLIGNCGDISGLSRISLGSGTTLQMNMWTGSSSRNSILMADGSQIVLYNGWQGGSGWSQPDALNADILLSGTASLKGSSGADIASVRGSVSSAGGDSTLVLGTPSGSSNWWYLSSDLSDGEGTLALRINSRLSISGSNSYSGGTTIEGGSVTLSSTRALGSGLVTVNDGTLTAGATTHLAALAGTGGSVVFNAGALILDGRTEATYAGSLSGHYLYTYGAADQSFTDSVSISNLAKRGEGTLSFTGQTSFTETAAVEEGTLALGGMVSLAQGVSISNAATVSILDDTTFELSTADLSQAGSLTIIDGGTIRYGSGLTATLNGLELDAVGGTLTQSAGSFTLSYAACSVWDGGASGTWSESTSGNLIFASDSTVSMGADVTAETVTVGNRATVSIAQTVDDTLSADTIVVGSGSSLSINAEAANYAAAAEVKADGLLTTTVSSYSASGSVGKVTGEGTYALEQTAQVDLGDHSLSSGSVDLSGFDGTVQFGASGSGNKMRIKADNFAGLTEVGTIVLNQGVQVFNLNGDVSADLVLNGDSGSSASASWGSEGFGAVRATAATTFKGQITVNGTALISGASSISFDNTVSGSSGSDTLVFGGYYATIPATTYTLRGGIDKVETITVRNSGSNSTTVTVAGGISGATNLKAENGSITVKGAMALSNNITISQGSVTLEGVSSARELDLSNGGNGSGSITLKNKLTTDHLWISGGSKSHLYLEGEGEYSLRGISYSAAAGKTATLTNTGSGEIGITGDGGAAKSNLALTNGVMTVTADAAASNNTVGHLMTDSALVNASGRAVSETNALNTAFTGVEAQTGDLLFLNKAAGISVGELVLQENRTVGVYTGSTQTEENEARLAIANGTLMAGSGSCLKADLTLSGSQVKLAAGGLAMGSTLTLNSGNTLDSSTYAAAVDALTLSGSYTLFSGVDGLTVNGSSYTEAVDASSVFTNFRGGQYYIAYSGTDVELSTTPEPATSTLSLLALAGLCLRRRRA